ncbi:hypothetical protein LN96_15185 [Xanthomonas citri pv. citri]|nr:hypothetical protein XAC29_21135 [Xanthomonas axonopodis Xac29-1]AKM27014.1 hypothetical protein AB890_20990 [Xanthomonas citri pv. citri]OOW74806.1 hypothetical protein Xmar_00025 [Xanthomonas axonopodis pv. martyniicola]OOW91242.1 hypothetical protein Xvtr_02830 [Xanthomonas campestris pv. vitiscarnosae]OOX15706.1 hypothetical protein Xbuh_15560 [Xanthomonas axonopodis pv. bauhiniae]OOX23509.1 hypothetical protein Xazr_02840 [Xanthomonas campestris pv. azadirachtae]
MRARPAGLLKALVECADAALAGIGIADAQTCPRGLRAYLWLVCRHRCGAHGLLTHASAVESRCCHRLDRRKQGRERHYLRRDMAAYTQQPRLPAA